MTPSDQRYEPSTEEPLFILAMDQRSSFVESAVRGWGRTRPRQTLRKCGTPSW